jgi:hypothetical protein
MAKRKTQEAADLPPELRDDYEPLPGEIVAPGGNPTDERTNSQTQAAGTVAATNPRSGQSAQESTWAAKTQCISDVAAGVRFAFDHNHHTGQITFNEKPSAEVRQHLKDNGYTWNREAVAWSFPINYESRVQDRLRAKKVFHHVAALIRQEKGIEAPSQAIPD